MMILTNFLWILLGYVTLVYAVQIFYPASIPLSVRSPYLNVWQDSTMNADPPAPFNWPLTWSQNPNARMSWTGKIRIDGLTYDWLGQDRNSTANVTAVRLTPTRSIYTIQIGAMTLNATFLSPVEPDDWVKQSIPFSYLSIDVSADDGAAHDVQLYSDITAEWVSGNRSSLIQYNFTTTNHSWYHTISLQNPTAYREVAEQADDGQSYYAMGLDYGAAASWRIDDSAVTRLQFINEGKLTNITNTSFQTIQVQNHSWPVYAFSVDLGHIQSTTSPVTWAVGFVRDPTIRYTTPGGDIQDRRPYFVTQFSDISMMIDNVINDSSAAYDRAVALDRKIMVDAANISDEYIDLVSLATRQTLGTLDITTYTDSSGKIDPMDVLIFMKDVGTSQRVNPVERMFAALPAFLYLNASLIGPMLKPLLLIQDGLSGQVYASSDLGTEYPIASSSAGADQNQGIEQTGNMLIMMYAHARFSGDSTLLVEHYNLTKRWADYLVDSTLTFHDQLSADGEITTNTTNLALKGIVGVRATAEIARVVGNDSDALDYDNKANALFGTWRSLAQSSSQFQHVPGEYGDNSSWSLLYNVYADALIGTNLVPHTLLNEETSFYDIILSAASELGLPIDSSTDERASTAWTLFTSAIVTNTSVRDQLIACAWSRASNNVTIGAFPDVYNLSTGNSVAGNSGPAGGAMYAHLALSLLNSTSHSDQTTGKSESEDRSGSSKPIGGIIGGVIGGLAALGMIGLIVLKVLPTRRAHLKHDRDKIDLGDELRNTPTSRLHLEQAFSFFGNDSSVNAHADGNTQQASQASRGNWPLQLARGLPEGYHSTGELHTSHTTTSQVTDGLSSCSISTTEVVGLRAEVGNLTQMMQVVRGKHRVRPPPVHRTEACSVNPGSSP